MTPDLSNWPSGKLPFDCQKIDKNLTFFPKKMPKNVSFFPMAIFLKKWKFLAIFLTVKLQFSWRVRLKGQGSCLITWDHPVGQWSVVGVQSWRQCRGPVMTSSRGLLLSGLVLTEGRAGEERAVAPGGAVWRTRGRIGQEIVTCGDQRTLAVLWRKMFSLVGLKTTVNSIRNVSNTLLRLNS